MASNQAFDVISGHRYFAPTCFNRAWGLIDKKRRTPEEDEEMILTALASLWHWSQRQDCTDQNRAIGYWQVSRVYALAGQADNARLFGQKSLEASREIGVAPFCLAYAFEALARAESVAGNREATEDYLEKARDAAERVPDLDTRKQVVDDLATIQA